MRLSKFLRICFLHLRLWNSSLDLLPPCLDVSVHLLSERLSLAKGASLAGQDRVTRTRTVSVLIGTFPAQLWARSVRADETN